MMATEKKQVVEFLANLPEKLSEQFNKGLEFLRNTEGRLQTQLVHLNKVGFNRTTLSTVIYELKKLHKISDSEIKNFEAEEKIVHHLPETIGQKFAASLKRLSLELQLSIILFFKFGEEFTGMELDPTAGQIMDVVSEKTGQEFYNLCEAVLLSMDPPMTVTEHHISELFSELRAEVDAADYPEELKGEVERLRAIKAEKFSLEPEVGNLNVDGAKDLTVETQEASDIEAQIVKVFDEASDEVKNGIKFRDEFPFLNDPNLPEELKILATDKISHYHQYADSQRELAARLIPAEGKSPEEIEQLTNDQIFALAKKAVENFVADQDIREEFVHYKEHGTILGNHSIFKQRKLRESIDGLTVIEATKRMSNLENYIRRDTKKSLEAKDPETATKFADKVEDWKLELGMLKVKLGVGAAK